MRRLLPTAAAVVATSSALAVLAAPVSAATVAGHAPIGYFGGLKVSAQTLRFWGWAADVDSDAAVRITAAVDGAVKATVDANASRPDVARADPKLGPNRGFDSTLSVVPGRHTLCVTAKTATGRITKALGCFAFSVAAPPPTRPPFGHVDALSYSKGKTSAQGWSIDPDTVAPNRVDVTVNGAVIGSAVASLARPDVAKAYPKFGVGHGFDAVVTRVLSPGNYRFCAVGRNTGAGPSTLLGCRIVTVLPATEPAELGTSTAAAAAKDLQAQAIASGAAKASAFPANASSAARIAIAARALLQQAAGRSAAPAAKAGIPKFASSGPTKIVDVQSVMGRTPALGTYPAAKTGGRKGANRSLELFRNDPLRLSGAAGDSIVGAAAVLPGNGKTVRPTLPAYPAGYSRLRAEVALDNAVAQLGKPYVWAAAGADTFDCSGLTQWAWGKAGVDLDHYTGSQAVQGVRVKANQLLPGDLVLFGGDLHHVGMYLGAGYMIDSPYTGSYVRVNKIAWYGDFTLAVRP
jgi:cell wall-associated NlpC family hydrolase